MGAKTSKSELTRRKSFGTLGRSSQRSLFQKSKLKLNRISKQIDKTTESDSDTSTLESIQSDIDGVVKELSEVSDAVKAKNQEKYDEVCRLLQSTRKKYNDKFEKTPKIQELLPTESNTSEIILRNTSNVVVEEPPETSTTNPDELRKPSVTFKEVSDEDEQQPKRTSVKFGVQVLPPSALASHVVLKRKTYPANSSPKGEFLNRNTTDNAFPRVQNGTTTMTTTKISIQTSNSFNSKTVSQTDDLIEGSSKRKYMKSNSILGIEAINSEINELEYKLKYFTGTKDSENYKELHQGLVHNLTLLDRIDTDEDPITKQEKRILGQRINELLRILECLVEEINDDCDGELLSPNKVSDSIDDRPKLTSVTAI